MTTPSGPDPVEMLRRLRARPVSSWDHGDRERAMRAALQQFVDLTADASGEPGRAVPDLGAGALADQFAVLYRDAVEAGVSHAVLGPLVAGLASALSV